jgi:hypothetical protein
VTVTGPLVSAASVRHPADPEPVASTKANTVLALGIVALLTGPLVGGMVPAVLALALARQARTDMVASRGYLTGAARLRHGEILAMIGLGLAAVTLVVAALAAMISIAHGAGAHDFPDNMN